MGAPVDSTQDEAEYEVESNDYIDIAYAVVDALDVDFGNAFADLDRHVVAPALGDAVWEPLDALDPLAKQAMVEAVTAAVSHDGRVSVAEAELLRTICGALR